MGTLNKHVAYLLILVNTTWNKIYKAKLKPACSEHGEISISWTFSPQHFERDSRGSQ